MNNIKQITDYDLLNIPSSEKVIMKAGKLTTYPYKTINSSMLEGNITKLGYCCEVKGIGYPIFLTLRGQGEIVVEIGKTGMYEFQEENWKNINDPESEEQIAQVYCTEVKVPADIHFTLDYFYTI